MGERWHYEGDINLEHGGFYWREAGAADYVNCVRVTPVSDAGGPCNIFEICDGSIAIDDGEQLASALKYSGIESPNPSRAEIVSASYAYQSIDTDSTLIVRIGPIDSFWNESRHGWNPTPDRILRDGSDLARFVRREFLKGVRK